MNTVPPLSGTGDTLPDEKRVPGSWERFLAARTSDTFCAAWLALICEKFPVVRQAAALIESADGQAFVPIAVWPTVNADMARMGAATSRA